MIDFSKIDLTIRSQHDGDLKSDVVAALKFAQSHHKQQKRKYTGEPYIIHPYRCTEYLSTILGRTREMVIAMPMHDVLEDTDCTPRDIDVFLTRRFKGDSVSSAAIVDLVVELTGKKTKGNRQARKEAEFERLSKASKSAKIMKMVDRRDNLLDLQFDNPEALSFAPVYVRESRLLIEAIGDANSALAMDVIDICDNIDYAIQSLS